MRGTASVSDGRQPPLTFKLQMSESTASRSLDALVGLSSHGSQSVLLERICTSPNHANLAVGEQTPLTPRIDVLNAW